MKWNKTVETFKTQGIDCSLHRWIPARNDSQIKASCVIFHGFKAHAAYPTVQCLAELLVEHDLSVFALDFPGHGTSPGKRGYIENVDVLVQHGLDVVRRASSSSDYEKKKIFLFGSSMGGAIALMVSKALHDNNESHAIGGVVLLAPMLQLGVSAPVRYLLRGLALIFPKLNAIPSESSNNELQYRDPVKRKEADDDKLAVGGNVCFASASACVEICARIKENCNSSFHTPMLVMIADEDHVVDAVASARLAGQFPSSDKTIKHYKALHGLLCEPDPLLSTIQKDIIEWILGRV